MSPRTALPAALAAAAALVAFAPAAERSAPASPPAPAATAAAAAAAPGALPRVRIATTRAIPDGPKVAARMRIPGAYRGAIGIERRGQSSQTFPKRSYSIELRGRGGDDRRVGLLGLPPDGDWVLHGPWIDKTLMRNALAYDVARRTGRWAPRTRHVELWLDGRYEGVYLLAERPELSRNRIDVEGEGVTGDYLVEWTFDFQAERKGPFFRLPISGRPIVYEDPELADLEPAEARYLRGFLRRAERAVRRGRGWRRYVDEGALVDYVLVQELFRNVDAFHASTFLVKESGRPVRFGPVWDFDLSTGNARQGTSERTRGWWTRDRSWVRWLWGDCRLRASLAGRWAELVGGGLRRDVLSGVDRYRALLTRGPAGRNFRRWPTLDERLWQSPRARGSYTAEVRFLRSWLDRRMRWMTRAAPSLRC
jgi:hypothetical protein